MTPPTTAAGSPASRPARRWRWRWRPRRRVSLRGLMVLVLVVGGVMGWQARRVSIQRRAVAAIRAASGWVAYDYMLGPYPNVDPTARHPAPAWVRAGLGDEPFQAVAMAVLGDWRAPAPARLPGAGVDSLAGCDRLVRLSLQGIGLDDPALPPIMSLTTLESLELFLAPGNRGGLAALDSLADLKRLRTFRVVRSPRDDMGLRFLRGLDRLESIELRETQVTDPGLAVLATLPRLYSVQLDGSLVTDAGLAHLGTIRSLTGLDLPTNGRPARYTDAGLAHLAAIPCLVELSLDATNLTAAGFKALQFQPLWQLHLTGLRPDHAPLVELVTRRSLNTLGLSGSGVTDDWLTPLIPRSGGLDRLDLARTAVTDAGMAAILRYPKLRVVNLDGTGLTDAGLARLLAAPALRYVEARGTRVTPAGKAAFLAVRPGVQITIGPLPPE